MIVREDLERPPYPFLGFGKLLTASGGGIEDAEWRKREEGPQAKVLAAAGNQLQLGADQ